MRREKSEKREKREERKKRRREKHEKGMGLRTYSFLQDNFRDISIDEKLLQVEYPPSQARPSSLLDFGPAVCSSWQVSLSLFF